MDRHLLVTGGSRGIGAAIVRGAAAQGWAVTFTYRNSLAEAEALAAELAGDGVRVRALAADRPPAEQYAAAEAGLGPVTALVNNAGITGPLGAFADSEEEAERRIFDVNVHQVFGFCRAAVRAWLDAGTAGSIVNIGSTAAGTGSPGEYLAYAASKAAVETFTRGLAKELGPAGIRAVVVAPGTTNTGIHAAAGDPGRPARVAARIPLGRPAEPEEVAAAVLWMLAPEAAYITGTVITVAGGQ